MKPFSRLFLYASFGLAALTMGCAEMNTGAAKPAASPSSSSEASAVTTGPTRVSTGTQGDTLEGCLSRIPSDATAGQKMLATMSCERDAKARTSIEAVPGK